MLAEQDEEARKGMTGDSDAEEENDGEEDIEDLEGQDEEDEEDNSSEDDPDKPLTRKELEAFWKSKQNDRNASRRVESKKNGANINKGPKPDDRFAKIEARQDRLDLLERKRQFGYENNLSPVEVDRVFQVSKNPTRKTLEDPFIKAGLDAMRSQARVSKNLPGSSGRSGTQHNGKDWKDLTAEEKQANFADRRRAVLESKQR